VARVRRPYMAAKVRSRAAAARKKKTAKRDRGRPSIFNPKVASEICERIADGETLRQICSDRSMPAKTTVLRWLARAENGEFRDQYARARELMGDSLAEEVIAIADDDAGDVISDGKGGQTLDWQNVQRSRLRVDARKWFASKVAPKRYGDRVMQELSGPDGTPIVTEQRAWPMTPAEVSAAVRDLVERAEKETGVSSAKGATVKQRLQRILESGELIPPQLYAALHGGAKDDGAG
jgi:Bacteriophage Sf6, terminase small subunit-like